MAIAELASVTPIGIATVRADRRDVLREVYLEHHDRLVGYLVRRMGDRRLAEDLAHDVMVRLAGAVDRLDPGRPVWPYLRMIAHNLAIDHRQRDAHQVDLDVEERLIDVACADSDLDDMVVLRSLLGKAIENLPPRQQVAVELGCLQGWNVADAAEFLGIDPRAFRQLLFRARRNLWVALKKSSGIRGAGTVTW